MTDKLLPIGDRPASAAELIGFDSAPIVEPVPAERAASAATLAAPAKPRRRRVAKPRKRSHSVRVAFDDDEFLKLSMQAGAQDMTLPEYLRHRALRDQRVGSRRAKPVANDLFMPKKVTEVTVVRLVAALPVDLERRIGTYFSPADAFIREPTRDRLRLPPLPNVFARLGHFMTGLVGVRWAGHRATPPART